MDYMILALVLLLAGILFYLHRINTKILKENRVLKEILEVKNTTITNLEAARVSVKEVIENLSMHDEVMKHIDAGESRTTVAEKLNLPLSKVELIVKFDKIKNASS